MKPIQNVFLPVFVLVAIFLPSLTYAQPSGFAVTGRGPDWRVLSKTTVENGTNCVHSYTELATGLNYQNSYGQWTESKEEITLLPTGGAVANQGRHIVSFPADIYNGVLEVVTPDGRHLKSRPLGVSYDDGSNTVFIATLKHAQGYLTSSNQVTYRDAFEGIKADLVCQYRRSGFECDLVFRQQPPTPGDYGLDESFSTLQMVTEFFNTADPEEVPAGYDDWFGLQDSTLKFGKLTMTHGKAFAFKGTNAEPSTISSQPASVAVYKSWLHLEGRTFLIESVPVLDIADNLNALPLTARNENLKPERTTMLARSGFKSQVSGFREFPPSHESVADTNQILLASADFRKEPGVVLDYTEINSDQTDFTFYSGETYFISGTVNLSGTTTIQGGAVLKYNDDGCLIPDPDNLTCPTDVNYPAILTSVDDNSVGTALGSGLPSVNNASYIFFQDNALLSGCTISNLRIFYAGCAILDDFEDGYVPIKVTDSQFINCGNAFHSFTPQLICHNVLFSGCGVVIEGAGYFAVDVQATHTTADECGILIKDDGAMGGSVELTNSILSLVPNMIALFSPSDDFYYALYPFLQAQTTLQNSLVAGENGHASIVYSENSAQPSSASGIYQTGGSANYYLAPSSPYRDVGTMNIDPDLLAELQTMTTYAPQDGGWPDTNTPDLGYHYPVNEDSDHDGLPDNWEWYWFGTYTNTGSQLDANGNALLSDYQNGTDPNVIQFSIESTNDYVNHTNISVQLAISGGVPSYYAIFVNSSTMTNWLPFTITNLALNIGTTDGVYNVVVGLKGFPTNAQQTWQDYEFFLDRVAPVLTITNPVLTGAAATVIKPYLQLQGFADEPLMSLSYDLSNAVSVMTNQNAFVTGQSFDTNKFDFTTNWFQAYDVPLTTNANFITLRVTDRAGNMTTTNFNVTLDYTTATNPPLVKLIWPTNGMAVSGTNITIRGTVSDETGSIMAQVINGDGTTNLIAGIVERNQMFWLENVPLNGTNQVSIQATDAAGNLTTTNFTVLPSTLVLTVDSTPTGDALYQSAGSVSGSVGDAGATVTVNGVSATVTDNGDGTGSWSADDVPIYGQGTATFDVKASTTGGQSAAANASPEMGPYVALVDYFEAKNYDYHWHDLTGNYWDNELFMKNYYAQVVQNNGNWQKTYDGYTSDSHNGYYNNYGTGYFGSWFSDYSWSDINPGTEHDEVSGGSNYDGPIIDAGAKNFIFTIPDTDQVWGCAGCGPGYEAAWMAHYRAKNIAFHLNLDDNQTYQDVTLSAVTRVNLYTGGKAPVARQNLFCIYAWAQENHAPPGGYGNPWWNAQITDVDKTSLTVMGKHPDAIGNVWVVLPDNSTQDITVTAPVEHYNAGAAAQKYLSHFEAFVDQPWPNFPKDSFNNDPEDPLYNPQPLGYPFYRSGVNGGHAWWKLTTEAPTDAVNQFANANASQWVNAEVSYGAYPDLSFSDWLDAILNGTSPTGSGELPWPNSHTATVHGTYAIGFPGLIAGLNHTEHVHEFPGTYDLRYHNCVIETWITGGAAGIMLPHDWMPEIFGFDLPPDSP